MDSSLVDSHGNQSPAAFRRCRFTCQDVVTIIPGGMPVVCWTNTTGRPGFASNTWKVDPQISAEWVSRTAHGSMNL